MSDEQRGWRVIEGPGTESTNKNIGPEGRELGKEPVSGAGYGASTGGVDGDPGSPGEAEGGIPEHDGPNAIAGITGLATADEEES